MSPKKPNVIYIYIYIYHVFAETTHVVTAPHGFARVVTPATSLYILAFIKIRSQALQPQRVEMCPFPLLWRLAFTSRDKP